MDDDPPQPGRSRFIFTTAFVGLCSSAFAAGEASTFAWSLPFVAICIAVVAGLLNLLFSLAQAAVSAVGPFALDQLESDDTRLSKFLRSRFDYLTAIEHRFAAAGLLALFTMLTFLSLAGILLVRGAPAVGATMGVLIGLLAHIVLAEARSRGRALADPLKALKRSVPLAWLLSFPLLPLTWLLTFVLPRPREQQSPTALTDLHLRLLSSLGGVDGVMQEETFELIDSVRDFAESTAEDIMRPRTELEGIHEDLSPPELYERLRSTEYSRLLVYGESMDDLKGVLLAKEVLLNKPENPFNLLRDPIIASEKASLSELLSMIRKHQTHLIVIQDEYGGTSGIVTLHDLLESIVGHIDDHEDEEEFWIEQEAAGSYRINGRVELWEVNDDLGLDLDEDVSRTIGGFIFNTLGRVPDVNDTIEVDGIKLAVEQVVENRIDRVLLEILETSPSEANGRTGNGKGGDS